MVYISMKYQSISLKTKWLIRLHDRNFFSRFEHRYICYTRPKNMDFVLFCYQAVWESVKIHIYALVSVHMNYHEDDAIQILKLFFRPLDLHDVTIGTSLLWNQLNWKFGSCTFCEIQSDIIFKIEYGNPKPFGNVYWIFIV